jgi:hypothetical protein
MCLGFSSSINAPSFGLGLGKTIPIPQALCICTISFGSESIPFSRFKPSNGWFIGALFWIIQILISWL